MMIVSSRRRLFVSLFCLVAVTFCPVVGASPGSLNGRVKDQLGRPLADILVALAAPSRGNALPVFTKTDEAGHLWFQNIKAGTYRLLVKSAAYAAPGTRFVQIQPGKTVVISLVLQQLFSLQGSERENLSMKTLLRSGNDRRLIFRTLPGVIQPADRGGAGFFEKAAFRVYTSAGSGGDYFVDPRGLSVGSTTNFAVKEPLGTGNDYIVAGQISSGADSLWRIKNVLKYELGRSHSVRLSLGYGRLSYQEPGGSFLDRPAEGYDLSAGNAAGTTRILSLELQDRISLGDSLSFGWGLELDQVRHLQSHTFVSPNAQLSFSPTSGTTFRLLMASKRKTRGNTITLPGEEPIHLGDAVYFSNFPEPLSVGRARHYQASVTQRVGKKSQVEVAAYRNQLFGLPIPFLTAGGEGGVEARQLLPEEGSYDRGYRVTFKRQLGPHLKTTVSYLFGTAVGLDSGETAFLVDESALRALFRHRRYHALATQLDAFIPRSHTRLTALVKTVPGGAPIATLDSFSNYYETSNQGVNLFVRQLVPVPASFLSFLGLDFLSAYTIEALVDIRNLTNEDVGQVHTSQGDMVLVQSLRTVRGGISLNF